MPNAKASREPDTPPARLCLVTPPRVEAAFAPLLAQVLAAVPVASLRLDLGKAPEEEWRAAINLLMPPCHEADIALIVTDHWRLVAPLGLDGVHLADARAPLHEVRKAIGADHIVGAFAGASRHRGMGLAEAGADYVAFGPVGDAGLLGDETAAGDDLFRWWSEMIEIPSIAEGGIEETEAARLSVHVDFITPARRLWDDPDPVARLSACAAALG